MLLGEEHAAQGVRRDHAVTNFGLTILATDLLWLSNEYLVSHGHYHYQAHAYVYPGCADPSESRGSGKAVNALTSSQMRPAQRKLAGVFVYGANVFRTQGDGGDQRECRRREQRRT